MRYREDPDIVRFSFWKPEPVPPNGPAIVIADLQSLGSLESVAESLMEIPRMEEVPALPFPLAKNEIKLIWDVECGVKLDIHQEEWPPRPGEVLMISLRGSVHPKLFNRLYVQVYERFGVTLLDEMSHRFITPREFRALA